MPDCPFPVLFQDNDYLAVAKPENLASIPEHRDDPDCLQNRLAAWRGDRIWVVHRLDKEVSGVIVFALNPAAHRHLNDAFADRLTRKGYLAVLRGRVEANEGEINRPIREFGSGRMGVDDARGKPSLTRWRMLERRADTTLVEAMPHTGRRHQLRVHFHSIGHSIAGDPKYGPKNDPAVFPRLLLHAAWLEFATRAGGSLRVECPAPADFKPRAQPAT